MLVQHPDSLALGVDNQGKFLLFLEETNQNLWSRIVRGDLHKRTKMLRNRRLPDSNIRDIHITQPFTPGSLCTDTKLSEPLSTTQT